MKKTWKGYLKRLAEDRVSNLLLSLMFLFDGLCICFPQHERVLFYISLIPLIADIVWCYVILFKRKVNLSSTIDNVLKCSTYAICITIALLVIIGIIKH